MNIYNHTSSFHQPSAWISDFPTEELWLNQRPRPQRWGLELSPVYVLSRVRCSPNGILKVTDEGQPLNRPFMLENNCRAEPGLTANFAAHGARPR